MSQDTPLISAQRLAGRLDDAHIRIADVRWYLGDPGRGRREYAAGHIPGAVFVDLDTDLAAPTGPGRHPLPDPSAFARRLAQLGFGSDDLVVAYDDASGSIAGRLWWMLDNLGHERVALLDGGLRAWQDAGYALSTDTPASPPAELHLADRWSRVIDRAELTERLGEVTLLDARAADRYRGETEPVDAAAGHIPTAVSAPARILLDANGTLLPPDGLVDRLAGVAPTDRPVVASCGSGVTACLTALSFRVAGLPDPLLYPGSFSDWSASGMPIATGDEPGDLEATAT